MQAVKSCYRCMSICVSSRLMKVCMVHVAGAANDLPKGDWRKRQYACAECNEPDAFVEDQPLGDLLIESMRWQSSRTAKQVMLEREEMITQLEQADKTMRESGSLISRIRVLFSPWQLLYVGVCAQWFAESDDVIKKVSETVNGQLLSTLLQATGYHDCECAELFRNGVRVCVFQDVHGA